MQEGSDMKMRLFAIGAALVAVSCSTPATSTNSKGAASAAATQPEEGRATGAASAPNESASAGTSQPSDESECLGKLQPPRGAGGSGYLQETVVSATESAEDVADQAREKLQQRVCQGMYCAFIDQHIQDWKIEQSKGYRCAMAVVKVEHRREWKRRVETRLSARLAKGAKKVVQKLRSGAGAPPRVSIHEIVDYGVAGGVRAEWLHSHMSKAFDDASAHMRSIDPTWSGHGIPENVDAYVNATIIPMRGHEKTFEVQWKLHTLNRVIPGPSVRFPAAVAPDVENAVRLTPLQVRSDKVGIHFDARAGGGLCHGQKTRLLIEADERMHVRVINLYGRNQGTVIYPATRQQSDVIKPGQPVNIGQFTAIKTGDLDGERFLVIAAEDKDDLGKFASLDRFCRLPSSMAGKFQRGKQLPSGDGLELTATSYRLVDDDVCKGASVSQRDIRRTKQALASAPDCWE
jgi:hypothetical protein